jgi:hypothetical protein
MEKPKGKVVRFIFLLFITFTSIFLAGSATGFDTSYLTGYLIEFTMSLLIIIALYWGYYLVVKYKFKDDYNDRFINFLNNGFKIQLIVGIFWAFMFYYNRYLATDYEEVKHLKNFILDIVAWIILILPYVIKKYFYKSYIKKAA